MFNFLKGIGAGKELDSIIQKIQMNLSNNYKDAAQLNLKEFEAALKYFEENNKITEKQKIFYTEKLSSFKNEMKNFTHKDQKPTWV